MKGARLLLDIIFDIENFRTYINTNNIFDIILKSTAYIVVDFIADIIPDIVSNLISNTRADFIHCIIINSIIHNYLQRSETSPRHYL